VQLCGHTAFFRAKGFSHKGSLAKVSIAFSEDQERYGRYLCSREWGILKEAVRQRCKGICERCHHYKMSHVHHLTYARKYNELLEDLQGLCVGCHEFTHGKRDDDPVLTIPVKIFNTCISGVYLAGKMSAKADWRSEIALGWTIGERTPSSVLLPDGRELSYRGPFWQEAGDSHASSGGPHYAADITCCNHWDTEYKIDDPRTVVQDRMSELGRCELLFAWLDSRDCFGTLVEIGHFDGLQRSGMSDIERRIIVATPRWDRELWFACAMADGFIIAPTARSAWVRLWSDKFNELGPVKDCYR
jgi:hypothetical protein